MNPRITRLSPNNWAVQFIGDDGTLKTRTGDTWEAVGRKLARVMWRRGRDL